jgi:hypothetical protein
MSETTQTPPTAEQLAEQRKAKEAKINARIDELKQCEGKTFVRNDGTGLPVKVLKYAGIYIKDGVGIYTFSVESSGHAKWNAPATEFLANYRAIDTAKTETSNEPI